MENPLDRIKEFLGSFQFRGKESGSILGIDIGSSSIKVVQLKKKRGVAVLETYGELALGPYADLGVGRATNLPADKLTEALNDILREANTSTQVCGVSIPFSASLISIMRLPKVEKAELANMIPLEARKYIPVPISEVTIDWFVIPEKENKFLATESTSSDSGGSKIDVLLVAIHNETLSKYRKVLEGASLSASFYEIEIFSTIRASLGEGIETNMIIDIGAASTKIYIVEFGIVRASHIINRGGQDITLALSRSLGVSVEKAEEMKREVGVSESKENPQIKESALLTLNYIFSEANRVLLDYQRKYNQSVGKVLFAGGGSVLKGLQEHARERFNVDVALADPFAKTQTPAFLEKVLKEVGPEFAVAVGAALRRLQEAE